MPQDKPLGVPKATGVTPLAFELSWGPLGALLGVHLEPLRWSQMPQGASNLMHSSPGWTSAASSAPAGLQEMPTEHVQLASEPPQNAHNRTASTDPRRISNVRIVAHFTFNWPLKPPRGPYIAREKCPRENQKGPKRRQRPPRASPQLQEGQRI